MTPTYERRPQSELRVVNTCKDAAMIVKRCRTREKMKLREHENISVVLKVIFYRIETAINLKVMAQVQSWNDGADL
jgi:hypothetical protein